MNVRAASASSVPSSAYRRIVSRAFVFRFHTTTPPRRDAHDACDSTPATLVVSSELLSVAKGRGDRARVSTHGAAITLLAPRQTDIAKNDVTRIRPVYRFFLP